ncbi:MAG: tRNA dimethylallyltransferase [Myxococcota bacterium]|nr:tRNA dimethylallyltransferase [Myxococcota bacterium]
MSRLIVIAGPTAAGKTALAVELARALDAEIVNVDSVQVYRGCAIGSAAPTPEEMKLAPHHLTGFRDPREPLSAGEFARIARETIAEILRRGKTPLVVAGAGLWWRALAHGLHRLPPANPELRVELQASWKRDGGAAIREELARADPQSLRELAPADQSRLIRALEVARMTGRTIRQLQSGGKDSPGYVWRGVMLDPDRENHRQRIAARFDAMVKAGLLEETRELLELGLNPDALPLKAIGYAQAIRYLHGEIGMDEFREQAIADTRRYAKRQRTWFRAEPGFRWIEEPWPAARLKDEFRQFILGCEGRTGT